MWRSVSMLWYYHERSTFSIEFELLWNIVHATGARYIHNNTGSVCHWNHLVSVWIEIIMNYGRNNCIDSASMLEHSIIKYANPGRRRFTSSGAIGSSQGPVDWISPFIQNICSPTNALYGTFVDVNLTGGSPCSKTQTRLASKSYPCTGPVFCLLLGVSSDCALPVTGQVTSVTWPVIGWVQSELTPSKGQKTGPGWAPRRDLDMCIC